MYTYNVCRWIMHSTAKWSWWFRYIQYNLIVTPRPTPLIEWTEHFWFMKNSWPFTFRKLIESKISPIHTHCVERMNFWTLKTSTWWVIRRIVLIWHPTTSFLPRTSNINYEINVFQHLKKRLMHSKCIFWTYLKQSGKSISKIGLNRGGKLKLILCDHKP